MKFLIRNRMHAELLPDQIKDLIFLKWEDGSYRGWRRCLLVEKMAKIEEKFIVCNLCQGLLRGACLVRKDAKQELRCYACIPQFATLHKAQLNQVSVNEKCIECPLKEEGCKWNDLIPQIFSHLAECEFIQEQCPLGCSHETEEGESKATLVERRFLEEHQMVHCSMRIVNCEFCNTESKAFEMNEHLENCEECVVLCPLSCVEEEDIKKLRRKDIQTHLEEDCPLQEVTCPYTVEGCSEKMERRLMDEHQKEICSLRPVNCESCNIETKAFEMMEHIEMCDEYSAPCPNSCEGESGVRKLKRKAIPVHLEKCPLQVVDCPNAEFGCKDKMSRQFVPVHEKDICPMRLINCEFCENEIRACEMNEHVDMCSECLVLCPNSCLESEEFRMLKRKDLPSHLEEECPLQVLDCSFAEDGCRERIERRLIGRHEDENMTTHFRMSTERMKENSFRITSLEGENTSIVDEISRIHKTQTDEISRIRYNHSLELMELKDEINFLITAINNSPRGSFLWKITGVRQKLKSKETSLSDPFYVGLYKCQSEIVWNHENQGHVGCFLHILKGDCDDKLTWPFRWKHTLILINQRSNTPNFVSVNEIDGFKHQIVPKCFLKPTENRNNCFELLEFISHDRIQKEKYLKNDSISLKIFIE